MNKLFLPYNLALLAKEKGFDEPCFSWYLNKKLETNKNDIFYFKHSLRSYKGYKSVPAAEYVSAPLYQQILDWFREKHGLYIELSPLTVTSKGKKPLFLYNFYEIGNNGEGFMDNICKENTYNKALNKAIEEAFKLI